MKVGCVDIVNHRKYDFPTLIECPRLIEQNNCLNELNGASQRMKKEMSHTATNIDRNVNS